MGIHSVRSSRFYEPALSVADAARCFIFNSTSSSSTDARSGADNEAQLSTGGGASAKDEAISIGAGQGVAAKDDGISLGGYGAKNTLGDDLSGGQAVSNESGVTLAGYANRNNLGGIDLAGNNTGTITINDTSGVKVIAETFATTVKDLAAQPVKSATIADLSEVKDTDERERASQDKSKITLWVLGILATVAIGWLFRPKKST